MSFQARFITLTEFTSERGCCLSQISFESWRSGNKSYSYPTGGTIIDVRRTDGDDPLEFDVVISEANGESRHHVSMARETYERLAADKATPEAVVEAAFRFLLDREPKESILGRFDVTVIARYFPEFERELPRYLEPT